MRLTKLCGATFVASIALCLGMVPMTASGADAGEEVCRTDGRSTGRRSTATFRRPATKPTKGAKIDPNDPNVASYAALLDSKHDDAVRKVGGKKIYDYRYAFNGFAAELTDAQVEKLRTDPAVLSVTDDEILHMDTSSTPTFLELDAKNGLWKALGGVDKAGEDIVIGMVDSGIWPEHPELLRPRRQRGQGRQRRQGRQGQEIREAEGLEGGVSEPASNSRPTTATTRSSARASTMPDSAETRGSMRLGRSSSIHRATGPVMERTRLRRRVATMALSPQAKPRRSAASAAWRRARESRCTRSAGRMRDHTRRRLRHLGQPRGDRPGGCGRRRRDQLLDQRSATNFRDPVEIAFLFAADAGVFVAASAGNSGPTTSTVAHPGPWLTTVAAGTHNRTGLGSTTLGNGATYTGASFANAVPSTPLVDSANAVRRRSAGSELCSPGALDPAKVAGKIVLCKRGTYALVDKSARWPMPVASA